jgi:protein required for attachment to host cells
MKTKLVIVANADRVKIFTDNSKKNMELTTELDHPENRQKAQELLSDRPGHYKTSGDSRGAYSLRTDPKDAEKNKFAIKVANLIESEVNSSGCRSLILISEPKFYGFLKKHLSKMVNNSIQLVIKKNPNGIEEHQLKTFILENRFAA